MHRMWSCKCADCRPGAFRLQSATGTNVIPVEIVPHDVQDTTATLLNLPDADLERLATYQSVARRRGSELRLVPSIRFAGMLRQNFTSVERSKLVWRNLPPAFVYRCRK